MSVLVVGLTCWFGSVLGVVADVRGVDPALIGAVGPQRVVNGKDQARADPVGRGRHGRAKVLPSAPVTRVVSMVDGRTGCHPRAELEVELVELTGRRGVVEL